MSAKLRELLMKVSAVDATFGDQFAVSNWMKANGTALLDELDALRAELAAAREECKRLARNAEAWQQSDVAQDAERYRWLRRNWTTLSSIATRSDLRFECGIKPWADFGGATIDAAIDAARAEGK